MLAFLEAFLNFNTLHLNLASSRPSMEGTIVIISNIGAFLSKSLTNSNPLLFSSMYSILIVLRFLIIPPLPPITPYLTLSPLHLLRLPCDGTTDTESSSTLGQFASNGAMDKAPSSFLCIMHANRDTISSRKFNHSSGRANCSMHQGESTRFRTFPTKARSALILGSWSLTGGFSMARTTSCNEWAPSIMCLFAISPE